MAIGTRMNSCCSSVHRDNDFLCQSTPCILSRNFAKWHNIFGRFSPKVQTQPVYSSIDCVISRLFQSAIARKSYLPVAGRFATMPSQGRLPDPSVP